MTSGTSIESNEHKGIKLRVAFQFDTDRFRHEVRLVDLAQVPDGEVVLLRSIEGPVEAHWPQSPPLQHLSIETIEGRDVGLLTGMSGRGHWSASVAPLPDRLGLEFDIAMQSSATYDSLGSTYALGDLTRFESSGANDGCLQMASGEASQTSYDLQVRTLLGNMTFDTNADDSLLFGPTKTVEPTRTVRWKYEIELLV